MELAAKEKGTDFFKSVYLRVESVTGLMQNRHKCQSFHKKLTLWFYKVQ